MLMQLMYEESADSNLGPFTVDARLTSVGGSVLYATGEGRVSHAALSLFLGIVLICGSLDASNIAFVKGPMICTRLEKKEP